MTHLQRWEKMLGKDGVKRLSPAWKRHIKRMDELPKPVRKISVRRYRELIRGY